jgi:hypothetical protein
MSRCVSLSRVGAVSMHARNGLLVAWGDTDHCHPFGRRGCALKRVKQHLDYQRIVRPQLHKTDLVKL